MEKTENLLAEGRLTGIRPFTRQDVDEWCTWPRHPDALFRDYNAPNLSAIERSIWYSERRARPDHEMYAITDAEGNLIGRLFLRQIDRTKRVAVLGIDLRSDRLDQGYGSDALRTFNDYYFGDFGFRVLRLDVAGYNLRAQRVYEKLGWVHVGEHWNTYPAFLMPAVETDPQYTRAREYVRVGHGTISILHLDMELTRDRWRELNAR